MSFPAVEADEEVCSIAAQATLTMKDDDRPVSWASYEIRNAGYVRFFLSDLLIKLKIWRKQLVIQNVHCSPSCIPEAKWRIASVGFPVVVISSRNYAIIRTDGPTGSDSLMSNLYDVTAADSLLTFCRILYRRYGNAPLSIWWRHNKSKMVDSHHIENRFSAIIRLTRNLDRRSRIIGKHRSHDQNSKFQKFKMADGRLFENRFQRISAVNQLISTKYDMQIRILIQRMAKWPNVYI